MKKLFNSKTKGFTIIELVVVIAIIGILILLAMPRFNGYVKSARITHIKNDIKVAEGVSIEELINGEDFPESWEPVNIEDLTQLVSTDQLYDVKGLMVNEVENGEYVRLADGAIKTKLKGDFYANYGGKVYYKDEKIGKSEEPELSEPELATDADFRWNSLECESCDYGEGYEVVNQNGKGYYEYIGKKRNIEIPHEINGNPMTSYSKMFFNNKLTKLKVKSTNNNIIDTSYMFAYSESVIPERISLDLIDFDTSSVINMENMFADSKIISLNLNEWDTSNVTNMYGMFWGLKTNLLDLSSFDTSNVKDMDYMFDSSQITKGYARHQSDADKFNNSCGKPTELIFTAK